MDRLRIFFVLAVFLIVFLNAECNINYESGRILVLHSYSPAMEWVERINAGIDSVLTAEHSMDLYISYEFLDAKRYNSDLYFSHFADAVKFKYEDVQFDAVICCDDHALEFILSFGDRCFPDVQYFFCGVNEPNPDILEKHPNVKGIYEINPILKTFQLIMKLFPQTERILVVSDPNTKTNSIYRRRIKEEVLGNLGDVEIELSGNMKFGEMEEKLSSLDDNTVVYYFSYLVDSTGMFVPHVPVAERLLRRCNRPVFLMNNMYFHLNVVGGYVTDPRAQGTAVALMVTDFLRGIPLEDILYRDYCNDKLFPAVFKESQMMFYHIAEKDLPQDAKIIRGRVQDREILPKQMFVVILIMIILAAGIIYLVHLNTRSKQLYLQKLENDQKWNHYFNSLPAVFFIMDSKGRYRYINNRIMEYMGLEAQMVIGKTSRESGFCEAACINDEDILLSKGRGVPLSYEYDVEDFLTNTISTYKVTYKPIYKNNELVSVYGYICDVTHMRSVLRESEIKISNSHSFFYKTQIPFLKLKVILSTLGQVENFQIIDYNRQAEMLFDLSPGNKKEYLISDVGAAAFLINDSDFGSFVLAGDNFEITKYFESIGKSLKLFVWSISTDTLAVAAYDVTAELNDITHKNEKLNLLKSTNERLNHEINSIHDEVKKREVLLVEKAGHKVLVKMIFDKIQSVLKDYEGIEILLSSIRNEFVLDKKMTHKTISSLTRVFNFLDMKFNDVELLCSIFLYNDKSDSFYPDDLIRNLIGFMDNKLNTEKIKVKILLNANCRLQGNAYEFALVLVNLLYNAIEAIDTAALSDGKIKLETNLNSEIFSLSIYDNAGEIPTSHHKKIFEPYFTTRMNGGSSGLGLFICKSVIENKYQGKISVENINNGKRFKVDIPCTM